MSELVKSESTLSNYSRQALSGKEILDGLVHAANWLEDNHAPDNISHWIYHNPESNRIRYKQVEQALLQTGITTQESFLHSNTHEYIEDSIPSWMSVQLRDFPKDNTIDVADLFLHYSIEQSTNYFSKGSMKEYLSSKNIPLSGFLGNFWEQQQVRKGKQSRTQTTSELENILAPNKLHPDTAQIQFNHFFGDAYGYQDRVIHKWEHADFGRIMLLVGAVMHDTDGVIAYGFPRLQNKQTRYLQQKDRSTNHASRRN